MSYDEVEIEDMTWNEKLQAYTYPCPCGDMFQITKEELRSGEEIARCPSCSLYITVIYNPEDFEDDDEGATQVPAAPTEGAAAAEAPKEAEAVAEPPSAVQLLETKLAEITVA